MTTTAPVFKTPTNGDCGLEFLRFGSSIPGSYWGCCACCIIQNFKVDPDAKASIQLVGGDGGGPIMKGNEALFAGPTYRDIFMQRIRSGTFDTRDMPNHAFIAILAKSQVESELGKKWLEILKETGFEFIRTVSNSVYAGKNTCEVGSFGDSSPNYIFMLVRNVGTGAIRDQFTPPPSWTALDSVVPEAWEKLGTDEDRKALTKDIQAAQRVAYDKIGAPTFLTEKELRAAGAPVILAGRRVNEAKPMTKENREALDAQNGKTPTASLRAAGSAVPA